MFGTLIRRLPATPRPQLTAFNNPYKTKKIWPPDFTKLSPQTQLKFEKKYKRRVLLRSARPRFHKVIKLAQLFSVAFVLVYSVLFMKWEPETVNPFAGIRSRFWEMFGYVEDERKKVKKPQKSNRELLEHPR